MSDEIKIGMKVRGRSGFTGTVVGVLEAPRGYQVKWTLDADRPAHRVYIDWGDNILADRIANARRSKPVKYCYAYALDTVQRMIVVKDELAT